MKLAVGIATIGRPAVLAATLDWLVGQRRPADEVIVAAPNDADVSPEIRSRPGVTVIASPAGLTRQRNAILACARDADAVVFFDDDFVPAADYLAATERCFAENLDVVVLTGEVLADGIIGPGLTMEEARAALAQAGDLPGPAMDDVYSAYGCNMAVRTSALPSGGAFDETLPLYGWLEDVDFSRRLAARGRVVRERSARGVHLGVKSGRQSGVRLGYSQVANPLYLIAKGSYSRRRAAWLMARNVAMNLARAWSPEPYVDRAGRCRGNLRAFADLLGGRLAPGRVLSL